MAKCQGEISREEREKLLGPSPYKDKKCQGKRFASSIKMVREQAQLK